MVDERKTIQFQSLKENLLIFTQEKKELNESDSKTLSFLLFDYLYTVFQWYWTFTSMVSVFIQSYNISSSTHKEMGFSHFIYGVNSQISMLCHTFVCLINTFPKFIWNRFSILFAVFFLSFLFRFLWFRTGYPANSGWTENGRTECIFNNIENLFFIFNGSGKEWKTKRWKKNEMNGKKEMFSLYTLRECEISWFPCFFVLLKRYGSLLAL